MKYIFILLFPIFLFADYIPITVLKTVPEGNLTRITQINNETFEFFKIYLENTSSLNTSCSVKYVDNYFSLTSGKPFKCDNSFIELINKNIPIEYKNSYPDLWNGFFYEFLLNNIGKTVCLIFFMFTFFIYILTHSAKILFIGVFFGIFLGFIVGLLNIFGFFENIISTSTPPQYSKTYLVKYYDDIEKELGYKVFRKGFYK